MPAMDMMSMSAMNSAFMGGAMGGMSRSESDGAHSIGSMGLEKTDSGDSGALGMGRTVSVGDAFSGL